MSWCAAILRLAGGIAAAVGSVTSAAEWTGVIRCEIDISAAGYSHQETQLWTLAGTPPTQQGANATHAASWSVTGQGWHDRTTGSTRRIASWSANAPGRDAPVLFSITPMGELQVQVAHAQLTVQNGYMGDDQFIQNGVPQPSQILRATLYENRFPQIKVMATDMQLSGSVTSQPVAYLGPLQPQGAQVTVTFAWGLGQGTVPPLPPSALPTQPPPPFGTIGSGPSPASPGPRDPTIGRPIGGGFTKQPEPTPMGPPRDPANFTATQTGPGTVELRWDPVPGVTTYVLNGAGMPEGRKVNTTSTTVTGLSPGVHEWLVTSWYDPDGSRTNANQWPRATVEVKALSGSYRVTITRVKFNREEPDNRYKEHGRNNEIFVTEHTQVIDRRSGQRLLYDGVVPHPGVAPMIHASPIHGDTHNANVGAAQYRISAGTVAPSGGIQTGDEIQIRDANQILHRNQTQNPGGLTGGFAAHPSPGIFLPSEYQPFLVWEGLLRSGIEVVLIRPAVWLAIPTWGGGSTDQFLAPYVARVTGADRSRDFLALPAVRDAVNREAVLIARVPQLSLTGQWLVDRHRPFGLAVSGNQNGATATWDDRIVVLTQEKVEAFLGGRTSRELAVPFRGTMAGDNATAMGDVSLFLKIERGPPVAPDGPVDIVPPTTLPPRQPPASIDAPVSINPVRDEPEAPRTSRPEAGGDFGVRPEFLQTLTEVMPDVAAQWSENVVVTITARNSMFTRGLSTIDLGPGVIWAGDSFNVESSTRVLGSFRITGDAAPGPRAVTVRTGDEVLPLADAFTVTPRAARDVFRSTPETAQQGQQNLTVNFNTFQWRYFQLGNTFDFGPGITVVSSEVQSEFAARAVINIDANAATHARAVTVHRSDGRVDVFTGVFTVAAASLPRLPPDLAGPSARSTRRQCPQSLSRRITPRAAAPPSTCRSRASTQTSFILSRPPNLAQASRSSSSRCRNLPCRPRQSSI